MITVGAWLIIDAVLDNAVAVAVQSGLDQEGAVAARASSLRERGWAANAAHPSSGESPAGGPPLDATLDLGLTDAEHRVLLAHLDDAVVITRSILAEPNLHPQVRAEQEESLAGELSARAELAARAA